MISQKEADLIMQKKGNSRGEVFKSYSDCFKSSQGQDLINGIEKKLQELNYPLEFKKIKSLDWLPEAYSELIMLILEREYNWKKEDFFNLGQEAPKFSFIIRTLMRHFSSPERVLKEASGSWKRYFDFGELTVGEYSEKDKFVHLELRDYDKGPLMCIYLAGYILRIAKLTIKGIDIRIKETKCIYQGDNHHEYLIEWS